MLRTIIYAILGAVLALVIGTVVGVGQWIGSGGLSFVIVIAVGALLGMFVAGKLNKK